jgi:molybdenum cofactor biosynthesis protein B
MKIRIATITFSDTRTHEDDESGTALRRLLEAGGFDLAPHRIVREDLATIRAAVSEILGSADVDAIVTTGGTGIAPRDRTLEAIAPFVDKTVDGFGEAFRRLSWDQVGSNAILSNAAAVVAKGKVVCALPGSAKAVRLGVEKLVIPTIAHMVKLVRGLPAHGGPR